MLRQSPRYVAFVVSSVLLLAGCRPQQPFYFHEDPDAAHYRAKATEIEYPDVTTSRLAEVENASAPFTLRSDKEPEYWNLTLEEAIRNALTNSKVIRQVGGQVQGAPDVILRNPDGVSTIYDPALAESNPRGGVEAALSAFDAQFSTGLFWEKNDTPKNLYYTYSGSVFLQDTGTFQTKVQKTAATGATWSLSHNVVYDFEPNTSSRIYDTDWNVNLAAEVRQPLLQGSGVQFNRIAGPGATPGVYGGVMLARINSDIALTQFEAAVRNLVSDVETAYWELYYQYRSLDAARAGCDSALRTWQKVYSLYTTGSNGGEAEKEAQAREQFFLFRSTAEQAKNSVFDVEAKLRYLMGLASADGRLIRPIDEPTTARVTFDWYDALNEGLARSVELRQIKWSVKRRELELVASKNFLLPKLDAVGRYRWLGLGNELITSSGGSGDFSKADSNAYQNMLDGKYQEWHLGVEMNLPLGFRKEMAGVRNAQLALARERAKLQEGELELQHQLASAIRDMEGAHVTSKTNFNRRVAAQRQVEAVTAAYDAGKITFDVLLESYRRLAEAETQYYRSLVNYNKAIMYVHYRKGSLLEYNGVFLAEGPWPGKAYFDAKRRARARDAGYYMDYGFTQPKVISRGPYEQHSGNDASMFGVGPKGEGNRGGSNQPELVPTPAPLNEAPTTSSRSPKPARIERNEDDSSAPLEPTPASDTQSSARKANAAATVASAPKQRNDYVPSPSGESRSVNSSGKIAGAKPSRSTELPWDRLSDSGVRQASSVAEEGTDADVHSADYRSATSNATGWKSTAKQPSSRAAAAGYSAYESESRGTTGDADQSASGWKGIQR